jgi:hypothetical protein
MPTEASLGAAVCRVPHQPALRLTRLAALPLAEDDVGRSVLQHKPLAKGEHTQLSLAKTFDDEFQRPKVSKRRRASLSQSRHPTHQRTA